MGMFNSLQQQQTSTQKGEASETLRIYTFCAVMTGSEGACCSLSAWYRFAS
jgi:hypothetical protein